MAPILPSLKRGRTHEACGPGARVFAAAQARAPVIWIYPRHAPERLMPSGLARFLPPADLITAEGAREIELLWLAEEALRSGAAGLVVAELTEPLGLTPGRRLQLAAEAGGATGLMLIRDGAGCNAAETRWHCAPEPGTGADSTRHRWSLIKNKSGTLGEWTVDWDDAARRMRVVPPAGERPVAARAPG